MGQSKGLLGGLWVVLHAWWSPGARPISPAPGLTLLGRLFLVVGHGLGRPHRASRTRPGRPSTVVTVTGRAEVLVVGVYSSCEVVGV